MKKILNFIKNLVVWLIVAATLGMVVFTIFSVRTFDRNNRSVLGYKFFIVRSDSMKATDFDAGDIVVVREVDDPSELKEGDIISYVSQNTDNFGDTVTHKIRTVTTDANGEPGFITYGTTTGTDDETVVSYSLVLGKYVGHIPEAGNFFVFLKTTQGYILCILLPFLLLLAYNGMNCVRLFRVYRQEQMDALKAEREKLEAERRQSAAMMKELQEMQARMAHKPDSDN